LGSLTDTLLFFTLAFAGTDLPWVTLALGDLGVKLLLAVLALAPFRAVLALALPIPPVRT
jgi:queuosine precursor transporter